jgi:alpha-tubulin suppressor-like RCC1 family protein
MATLGFVDTDGSDISSKFVTKDYIMDWYPDLVPNMNAPQLWSWGYDGYGSNGRPGGKNQSLITNLGNANWKQVANGGYYGDAGIKTDGTLWTWGKNNRGQLGDNTTTDRNSPVTTVAGGTNWKQVACSYHTAAIKTDGTLWTWGRNFDGQLGDNTTTNRSSPVTVVGGGTNWKQVACGHYHTIAIKTDGVLWTWGYNASSSLGNGTTTDRSSPGTTVGGGTNWKTVSCGRYHNMALKTDGTLWSWGSDGYGQQGKGGGGTSSSPQTIIGSGYTWKQASCGHYHNMAIRMDGTLWACGRNDTGQLGDGTTSNRSSLVQVLGNGINWKQVAAGRYGSAAIKIDGSLWVWGFTDAYGQRGTNYSTNYSSPVTTTIGGTNWKQIACSYVSMFAISESEGW